MSEDPVARLRNYAAMLHDGLDRPMVREHHVFLTDIRIMAFAMARVSPELEPAVVFDMVIDAMNWDRESLVAVTAVAVALK